MLTCPPSRISLTAVDLASFDRRWAARQAARRDTENVRLGQGAARQTRLAFVPAAANNGRHRAASCSSQATICTTEDDDPTIHSNAASPAQHFDLPNLVATSNQPRPTADRTRPTSPQKQTQRSDQPGPSRLPVRLAPELDFLIYEDPPTVQAYIEARHFQHQNPHRMRDLEHTRPPNRDSQEQAARTQLPPNVPQVPTLLYPSLDPGAPVFVPRTRFGSTATTSDHNGSFLAEASTAPAQRDQSTTNLRLRSSFERNTQNSSHSTERQSVISDSSVSLVPSDIPQTRRRSRNNDQNAALHRPLLGFDRYPAVRPPVAFASRRNSGSQRQVVFPRRRSSRQHLIEFERSRRSQEAHQQNRPTHLAVPQNDGLHPVSPAPSTSSRSTPNLLQPPSVPYTHVRSSSLSSDRSAGHMSRDIPRRSRKAATAVSESSSLLEEILLQRDSPLDRIVQKYGHHPARPRSVGHSFERPPGRHTRPSLLNGDLFRPDTSEETQEEIDYVEDDSTAARPTLKGVQGKAAIEQAISTSSVSSKSTSQTPHKRQPTIEDPVALALALPSPEVPSSPILRSSPALRSSPLLPSTPILRSAPSSPLSPPRGTSSAAKSRHSAASLTPSTQSLAAAITPRVPVYNDSRPTAHQPQTPADIARSSRRARGRSNTTSTTQSNLSSIHPSPTLAPPPERSAHRHTFPSATTQEVTVGTTPIRTTAVMEPASTARRDSLMVRFEQRSSGSSENDIEGNLDGLEQDRRVWMRRREDGSLDVTPPREGRFERYLS